MSVVVLLCASCLRAPSFPSFLFFHAPLSFCLSPCLRRPLSFRPRVPFRCPSPPPVGSPLFAAPSRPPPFPALFACSRVSDGLLVSRLLRFGSPSPPAASLLRLARLPPRPAAAAALRLALRWAGVVVPGLASCRRARGLWRRQGCVGRCRCAPVGPCSLRSCAVRWLCVACSCVSWGWVHSAAWRGGGCGAWRSLGLVCVPWRFLGRGEHVGRRRCAALECRRLGPG